MSRHVQNTDASVLERRLRPIYDWLDSGNNKKALQECDKVLKKTPNLHCAKALKALTLLRMGRDNDTNVILDNLTNATPTDEATLQAMALCYREMQQMEKVCQLYETAVKLDPANEELHTHLFMSYVRVNDFKSQQQSAMALYKQKPKNPYYCWNVMSIILQATRGEGSKDEGKRKLLLSLAERMMQKLVDENKIDAEQEIQLYIMVLELQKKYEKILEVLDTPLNEKLQCTNIPQSKLTYLKKLQRWPQVNILCKAILSESFDRWDVWKDYVHSVFELAQVGANGDSLRTLGDDLEMDNTAEKCHEFICGVIEGGADNSFLLRGPYLARFELCAKLQEKNIKTDDLLGDTNELFIEYFRKFGHKPCCVQDLRIYLKLLDSEQKSDLATKLIKEVGIGSTSVPQSADQMQCHIGALQLSRLCAGHRDLSPEHLRALVTALTLHYQHGYQSYGKGNPTTDLGPSDGYALLGAHILHDLSRKEDGVDYSIAALALLESLLKNSPANFHAKLLALKLYHTLGDVMGANNMYYSLDIKHLQLDSLGYIHCGRLATTGLFSLCAIHFDTALKFFSSNYRDITSLMHLTFLESLTFAKGLKPVHSDKVRALNKTATCKEQTNSLHHSLLKIQCPPLSAPLKYIIKLGCAFVPMGEPPLISVMSTDHLTFSYKFGSFMKLDEFMDFREKMNNSMHYTTVVVDRIILSLVDCASLDSLYNLDISPRDNKIEWDKLRDNRDFQVFVSWEPEFSGTPAEESEEIKKIFSQDLKFLRLRTYILWSLSAGIEVLKSMDGTRLKNIDYLKQMLKDWKEMEDSARKSDITPIREDLITYPLPSRLHGFLDTPYRSTITALLEFFQALTANDIDESKVACAKAEQEVEKLSRVLEQKIMSESSDFREKRKEMELAVNTVEVICVACVVCIMCSELVKPPQAKKGKKKQHTESESKDCLNLIVNQTKTQINLLSDLLERWSNRVSEKDLVNILESLNLNVDGASLRQNVIQSYSVSNKEIQGVLKNKLKLLSSL